MPSFKDVGLSILVVQCKKLRQGVLGIFCMKINLMM